MIVQTWIARLSEEQDIERNVGMALEPSVSFMRFFASSSAARVFVYRSLNRVRSSVEKKKTKRTSLGLKSWMSSARNPFSGGRGGRHTGDGL